MLVSVIITTYNYGHFVERAVRSVMDQSLDRNKYEILIINDASTDHTCDILSNYEDVVRIFNLEKNMGLAAARNFGIKKAKGQFIVFVDADDYVHRDLLYVERLFLELNNNIDAVSCDYFLVDEKGKHIRHISADTLPIACGIMFRKDYLYNIGLYDETFKAREEEDLRLRFLKKFSIYNLTIPLYRYRMHDENLTKNTNTMDYFAKKLKDKHG
jgi:glycosyltransferase involved in cell wall biosynthesis